MIRLFALIMLSLCMTTLARIVSESEPNNGFAEANLIECSDTVMCAHLDISEGDFYRMIVPGGDSVYFRTFACDSNQNTVILLYDSSYALIGINDNGGPQEFSTLGVFLQTNQLCCLQVVDPSGASSGAYTLSMNCQTIENGVHGLCENARQVTFFPYYDESTTFGAGNETGTAAPDVYYQFSLATPGDVLIQVCSASFDSRVQIFSYCLGGMMDDASEGVCQLGADLSSFGLLAQSYYILVEGTSANQYGEFSIEVSPLLQECPVPQELMIFSVGNQPFLDWLGVPEADYYLIEQAQTGDGPFEAADVTTETFWQDPLGFAITRRFYHVRSICE